MPKIIFNIITDSEADEDSLFDMFKKYFKVNKEDFRVKTLKIDNVYSARVTSDSEFSEDIYKLADDINQKYNLKTLAVNYDKSFRYFPDVSDMIDENEEVLLWIIDKSICNLDSLKGYSVKKTPDFTYFKMIIEEEEQPQYRLSKRAKAILETAIVIFIILVIILIRFIAYA